MIVDSAVVAFGHSGEVGLSIEKPIINQQSYINNYHSSSVARIVPDRKTGSYENMKSDSQRKSLIFSG